VPNPDTRHVGEFKTMLIAGLRRHAKQRGLKVHRRVGYTIVFSPREIADERDQDHDLGFAVAPDLATMDDRSWLLRLHLRDLHAQAAAREIWPLAPIQPLNDGTGA
jgi:hypothetical protein